MRLSRISDLNLDGVLNLPERVSGQIPSLIVCHPHPAFGGDMNNSVVMTICQKANLNGFATLRFNFRGVGLSEGQFGGGEQEKLDVKSALDVLRNWPGLNRKQISLCGYSFGAGVIGNGIKSYKQANLFVFVSPPVESLRKSGISENSKPMLFITGQRDKISNPGPLQSLMDEIEGTTLYIEIPNADHSLVGYEYEVADRVVEFVIGAK